MNKAPDLLLADHLKKLKLPTVLREYDKRARQCAAESKGHVTYLSRRIELELIDRERRMVERRIKAARFTAPESLDSFDFKAIPALNKTQVLELARCGWSERRENVIALGPSGTGKTRIALGLGLAACQRGLPVRFITAAALVHELIEARDEKRLLRLHKQMLAPKLLIIDALGFVPLSKTGAELLFELVSQRYERSSTLITSNLPFEEWTETFGSERLTGALLDRLTHHVSILEMNGESYRLDQRRKATQKHGPVIAPDGAMRPGTRLLYGEPPFPGPPQTNRRSTLKWPTFMPPDWPNFAPPLTRAFPVFVEARLSPVSRERRRRGRVLAIQHKLETL